MITTKLRKELHEFGPFTVEVWEESEGSNVAVKVRAKFFGAVILYRKVYESFDTAKAGVKETLQDAAERWRRQINEWDHTQESTRP